MGATIGTVIAGVNLLGTQLSALSRNPVNPFSAADVPRLTNWAGAAVAVQNPYLLNLSGEGLVSPTAQSDLDACQTALDAINQKLAKVIAGAPPAGASSDGLINEARAAISLAHGLY
jgi:hypothetical protein